MGDLEICKRIADIEGLLWMVAYPNTENAFVGLINENDLTGTPPELIGEYNPLKDKAICFDLIVKYELEVFKVDSKWFCIWTGSNITKSDENPQRAVCLAIIEAYKNE